MSINKLTDDIQGLGVSPAKSYGHVAGTDARFFGQGIINIPEPEPDDFPFKTFIRATQNGGLEYKCRPGKVDGIEVNGAEEWKRIVAGQSVIVECNVSDYEIKSAKLDAKKPTKVSWFVGDIPPGMEQKVVRHVIATVYVDGPRVTLTQNVRNHLTTIAACYKGTACMLLRPDSKYETDPTELLQSSTTGAPVGPVPGQFPGNP